MRDLEKRGGTTARQKMASLFADYTQFRTQSLKT